MSAYGPALFIKRKDGKEIPEKEQKDLLTLVKKSAKELKIKDEDDKLASPSIYDYGEYEQNSLAILMFSSEFWAQMSEQIKKDYELMDKNKMFKIGKLIDKKIPDTYQYDSYYVEC